MENNKKISAFNNSVPKKRNLWQLCVCSRFHLFLGFLFGCADSFVWIPYPNHVTYTESKYCSPQASFPLHLILYWTIEYLLLETGGLPQFFLVQCHWLQKELLRSKNFLNYIIFLSIFFAPRSLSRNRRNAFKTDLFREVYLNKKMTTFYRQFFYVLHWKFTIKWRISPQRRIPSPGGAAHT